MTDDGVKTTADFPVFTTEVDLHCPCCNEILEGVAFTPDAGETCFCDCTCWMHWQECQTRH